MKFNRRTFLQGAGLTVASWGSFFGESLLPNHQLNGYAEALGDSTSRKLALLVGINQYPALGEGLRGCVTDVELQRELLVSRFGFGGDDIVSLTDGEATREGILRAFDEHLAQQATENDVVVFHFSGYGRRLRLDESNVGESLVTYGSGVGGDDDILLDSLVSLFQTLKTSRYTVVLDTSYEPLEVSTTTKLWVRCYGGDEIPVVSDGEWAFNQSVKQRIKKPNGLLRGKDKWGGVIFTAATEGVATEIVSGNFNAGLFTYALTQSLWQGITPMNNLVLSKKLAANVALVNGELRYTNIGLAIKNDLSPYYVMADGEYHGDMVVTNGGRGNGVDFDLVGLPLWVLFNYGLNSCFSAGDVVIQVSALAGNKGKGVVLRGADKVRDGMVLRESVRVISRDVDLMVGLDSSLQRIEKVDATSALTSVGDFKAMGGGDSYGDCILGRVTVNGSYGLFSLGGVLLPNTMAKTPNEAVSTAVKRLGGALHHRLAQKLVNLTLNGGASGLPVRVGVEYGRNGQNLVSYQQAGGVNVMEEMPLINVTAGSAMAISIYNDNDYDLYYMIVGFNSSGRAIGYCSTKNVMVNAGETLTVPDPQTTIKLVDNGNQGIGELIIICAKSPFNNTFNQLYKSNKNSLEEESIMVLDDPVGVAKAILLDLHEGSGIGTDLVANISDVYALDLNNWASFNFVYEIER